MSTLQWPTSIRIEPDPQLTPDRRARELIAAIRSHYSRCFASRWFQRLLARLGFEAERLEEIHTLLSLDDLAPADTPRLRRGVYALGEFVYFCRMRLIPELQRELGIAGFPPRPERQEDEVARMAKEWFLSSLPAKLGRLTDLTEALRDCTRELHRAG
jgi:hypothetical protein